MTTKITETTIQTNGELKKKYSISSTHNKVSKIRDE